MTLLDPSSEQTKLRIDNLKIIHDYAWNWFSYHAAQRMTVFRFFSLLIGGLSVGFYQTLPKSPAIAFAISVLALLFSVLFWRLDLRTRELIRIGEDLLKESETEFNKIVDIKVGIIELAAGKNSVHAVRLLPSRFYSYAQIFSAVFLLMVGSSALAALYSFTQSSIVQTALAYWARVPSGKWLEFDVAHSPVT
jgi:hypothetical protein